MVTDARDGAQCWTVLILALAALAVMPAQAFAGERLPSGTLSGTIVDPDGRPVSGTRVFTSKNNARSSRETARAEAKTDANGRFRLGPLDPEYRRPPDLIVEAEGYAALSTRGGEVSVYSGRDFDVGTLRLDRGRVFTGRVVDFDGKPCPNVAVTPGVLRHYLGHTVTDIGSGRPVTTDAGGRFRTPPLPVGLLSLTVRAQDRQLAYVRRAIRPGGEEDLGDIPLQNDVPFVGKVQEASGEPIAGVTIGGTVGYHAVTDAAGRFTLRGFGPNPSFQLNVRKGGYAPRVGMVVVSKDGARYLARGAAPSDQKPARELVVVLKRAGLIEGSALDADTGEPVHLSRIVVCNFERKPSGEAVLRGCQNDAFEQPQTGRFRAHFPSPDEYHLTLSAEGYHDGEAFTPKVGDLTTIQGIIVKMKKKTAGSSPAIAKQTIAGKVTRDGHPIKTGWVGLWALRGQSNALNAPVKRGRTVVGDPIAYASASIRDGNYTLDVPFQNDAWYVVVEEPGHAITQIGPIPIALKEQKNLDVCCVEGGRLSGRVKGVPAEWAGHAWVVAFSKSAVRAEARVNPDGSFSLAELPPGEYGLKVGHDAYEDPEVYPGKLVTEHRESTQKKADPWQQAKVAKVEVGRATTGVELEFPR